MTIYQRLTNSSGSLFVSLNKVSSSNIVNRKLFFFSSSFNMNNLFFGHSFVGIAFLRVLRPNSLTLAKYRASKAFSTMLLFESTHRSVGSLRFGFGHWLEYITSKPTCIYFSPKRSLNGQGPIIRCPLDGFGLKKYRELP